MDYSFLETIDENGFIDFLNKNRNNYSVLSAVCRAVNVMPDGVVSWYSKNEDSNIRLYVTQYENLSSQICVELLNDHNITVQIGVLENHNLMVDDLGSFLDNRTGKQRMFNVFVSCFAHKSGLPGEWIESRFGGNVLGNLYD